MISLLITGTDTGVGKTWVGRALSHALVAAGRRVVAVKRWRPAARATAPHLEDGALLAAATGQVEPRAALFRFTAPVAPALAAEREGEPIDLDALVLEIERLSDGAEVLLVEEPAACSRRSPGNGPWWTWPARSGPARSSWRWTVWARSITRSSPSARSSSRA